MDMVDELDRETNMQWIRNRLARDMWENVTEHPANGGLWDGEAADFQRAKSIHHRLLASGQVAEAQALRAIVTHNVWYAQRATKDPKKWRCPRCGEGNETLLHRLWTCPDINNCTHPAVATTQGMISQAVQGCAPDGPKQSCLWLGGLLPASMQPPRPPVISKRDCYAREVGNFAKCLKATGKCGVDGSGGTLFSSYPRLRTVGAGAGAQIFNDPTSQIAPDKWVEEEAYLASPVPGLQTVPRAEAWAIYLVLQVWDGTYDLEILTDATYTVSGMDPYNRKKHLNGTNKDIWGIIYRELDDTLDQADSTLYIGHLTITKIKSHSTGKHNLCRSTPLWQTGLNQLADKAADEFSDAYGNKYQLTNLKAAEAKHRRVCLRLAALEAGIREGTPERPRVAADIIAQAVDQGEFRRQRATDAADQHVRKVTCSTGHKLHFTHKYSNGKLCKNCRLAVHQGRKVPEGCSTCGPQRGTWRCTKCNLTTRKNLDRFWEYPCHQNDPLDRVPALSGQRTAGGNDLHDTDLQTSVATRSELSHFDRTGVQERSFASFSTSGIQGLDPRNLHDTRAAREEARAHRERDQLQRDYDADNITDSEAPPPPAPKAKAAIRSAFLPAPEPPPTEEGATPHLTDKAAKALAKDTRAVQRQLTQDLKDQLRTEEHAAAHSSSSKPTFLHGNNIEDVHVHEAHPWARVHKTHDLWRCDMTACCRKCGSVSNTNSTKRMRDPCDPSRASTPYHAGMLDALNDGHCPAAWPQWQSGLAKHLRWPPVPLRVFTGDNSCHTSCECGDCQLGNSCGPIPAPPVDSPDPDQDNSQTDIPPVQHHPTKGTAAQQAEDHADLLALERGGTSIRPTTAPFIQSATVAEMPDMEPPAPDDEQPPSMYSGDWNDRTQELRTMWDLECSGTTVEWQDAGDRKAIREAVARELSNTIAATMQAPDLGAEALQANSSTPSEPRPIHNQDLIALLDQEGAGGTTLLIEPSTRERAISARLEQFWTTTFSTHDDGVDQLPCEWPELLSPVRDVPAHLTDQDNDAEAQVTTTEEPTGTPDPRVNDIATVPAQTVTTDYPDGNGGNHTEPGGHDAAAPHRVFNGDNTAVNWCDDVTLDRARLSSQLNRPGSAVLPTMQSGSTTITDTDAPTELQIYSQHARSSARPPGQA